MYEVDHLVRRHGNRTVLSIDRLRLGGEGLTSILGHNGSGKSTLMGLLARSDSGGDGKIRLNGASLDSFSQRELARQVAFLPQRLPPVPGLTTRELVGLGRYPWRGALGRWRAEDHAAVEASLRETGCDQQADMLVEEMSGGERQRGFVAMLLAQESPLLLLDEPTSALDPSHAHEVMVLLRRLTQSAGRRVIVVLHDVNLATRFSDRILALRRGQIVFDGAPSDFLRPAVLSHLYDVPMTVVPGPPNHPPVAVVA